MYDPLIAVLDEWSTQLPERERSSWTERLGRVLLLVAEDGSPERLGVDQSWILLGWCEEMASAAVRASDPEMLVSATSGLLVLASRGAIDLREVLLVGALVRRAVAIVGCDWERFCSGMSLSANDERVVERFPQSVSLASHREVGSGAAFRFVRVPLTTLSAEELHDLLREH